MWCSLTTQLDEKPPVPDDPMGRCMYFHCHKYHLSDVQKIFDDGPDVHCDTCKDLK